MTTILGIHFFIAVCILSGGFMWLMNDDDLPRDYYPKPRALGTFLLCALFWEVAIIVYIYRACKWNTYRPSQWNL